MKGLALFGLLLLPLGLVAATSAQTVDAAELAPPPTWNLVDAATAKAMATVWARALDRLQDDMPLMATESGVKVTSMLVGTAGSFTLILKLEGDQSPNPRTKYLQFASVTPSLPLELARALEALLRPAQAKVSGVTPRLIDQFSLQDLQGLDLPLGTSYLSPYGLAQSRSGHLLVACINTVLELDQRWQVVGLPAQALTEEGQVNFAFGLAVTPAGTLYVRSSDGTGLWSFVEGSFSFQKLRVDLSPGSLFGLLGEGVPFAISLQPKSARLFRPGGPVDLPLPPDAYYSAACPGPDNSLCLFDQSKGSIRIVSPEGDVRDIIYPELDAGQALYKMTLLPDGSYLAVTLQDLRHFDARGNLLWLWNGKSEGLTLTFSTLTDVVRGSDGVYFVNDYAGHRILRFSEDPSKLPVDLATIASAYQKTLAQPSKPETHKALAEAYRSQGADEAERVVLDRYLELRPMDASASDRKASLQTSLLKTRAAAAEKSTRDLLARLGPESAREAYSRAMKVLERLRSLAPQDQEVTRRILSLRTDWGKADDRPATEAPLPEVRQFDLAALFPSLLQAYRTRRAGTLVLQNTLGEALKDLRVEVYLPHFMDFPSAGATTATLEPGHEATLPLQVLLNDQVLNVEEDLPLQVQITVRFADSQGPRSFQFLRPLTLYRRTALTWSDTAKLASFVTPNEDTVAKAAFRMLRIADGEPVFSGAVARASAVCAALGALPLRYVPDPRSSFSLVSADPGLVDTVRFPRMTLAYQGGDCDDTTALLASLLEASGLGTAILTTPGHVFLAFDSQEPEANGWMFPPGLAVLKAHGTLWIPLESTDLQNGFTASWKAASALVAKYQLTRDFEMVVVADQRATYPALPLPPSTLPAPQADSLTQTEVQARGARDLRDSQFTPILKALEAEARTQTGSAWSKTMNRLAQWQSKFLENALAVATLKAVVQKDPTYVTAYLNLAALSLKSQKREEAAAWLSSATSSNPGSTRIASFASQVGLGPEPASNRLAASGSTTTTGEPGRAGVGDALTWQE
ncbi:MAG: tetratricopeptide repeat protein [Spirochaetales bacterium]